MKELYNNSVEFVTSELYMPIWLIAGLALSVLVLMFLVVYFNNKSLVTVADLESRENEIINLSLKLERKEKILKETQTKFATYKHKVENAKPVVQPEVTARVGKSGPSRKIDSVSEEIKESRPPRPKK